jgi:hypothetical protein
MSVNIWPLFYFMIGQIISTGKEIPANKFTILDKVLVNENGVSVTKYLCQLKQQDGLGRTILVDPFDLYFPFIPKEVVL